MLPENRWVESQETTDIKALSIDLTPQPRLFLQLWKGNTFTTWHVLLSQARVREGRKSLATKRHRFPWCETNLYKAKINREKEQGWGCWEHLSVGTINTDRANVYLWIIWIEITYQKLHTLTFLSWAAASFSKRIYCFKNLPPSKKNSYKFLF